MQKNKSKQRSKGKSSGSFVGVSGWGLAHHSTPNFVKWGNEPRVQTTVPADTKFYNIPTTVAAAANTANTLYTQNVLAGIAQGTADTNRLGDFVHIENISLSFTFDTTGGTAGTQGVSMRVMLVSSTVQSAVGNFTAGLTAAQVFFGGSALVNAIPDTKRVHVFADKIYDFFSTTTADFVPGYLHCRINKPFEYQTGLTYGTAANLYLLIISSGAGAPAAIGALNLQTLVSFRDQ